MRYFMTLLFVLLAYAVFAQNDPKAKEILDKAAAKFKAYPAAEIDFTLTMEISIPICRKYRKSTSKIPMKKKKRC